MQLPNEYSFSPSCRNIHCRVICPLKLMGTRRSGAQILQAQILSGSSLLCNWLHFPQETGIHIENEASHRDILCTGYLMSGPAAVQRFWYGWKMYSFAFTAIWHAFPQSERLLGSAVNLSDAAS